MLWLMLIYVCERGPEVWWIYRAWFRFRKNILLQQWANIPNKKFLRHFDKQLRHKSTLYSKHRITAQYHSCPVWDQGQYSISGKTSYHQVSWNLEAPIFDIIMIISLWNLTGIFGGSAAADVPVKFQSDWKSLNPNLMAPILHKFLW